MACLDSGRGSLTCVCAGGVLEGVPDFFRFWGGGKGGSGDPHYFWILGRVWELGGGMGGGLNFFTRWEKSFVPPPTLKEQTVTFFSAFV